MELPDDPEGPRCRAFDPGYNQKGKSKKQEKRVANFVGGRVQPASGALGESFRGTAHSLKADVKNDDFLIEAKRTDAKSISITGEWLFKIMNHAAKANKHAALAFEIGGFPLLQEKDWIAIPMSVFQLLLERSK